MIWQQLQTLGEQVIQKLDVPTYLSDQLDSWDLPLQAYIMNGSKLFDLARDEGRLSGDKVIKLPLDHHLEVRCFGLAIKEEFNKGTIADATPLRPPISSEVAIKHPAFQALIVAIQLAKQAGYPVITNVSGIYTILASLKGPSVLAKYKRSNFEQDRQEVARFLLTYLHQLMELEVDIIHLGEPLVTPLITGSAFIVEAKRVYQSFLKDLVASISNSQTCLCLHPMLGYLLMEPRCFESEGLAGSICHMPEGLYAYKKQIITLNLQEEVKVIKGEELISECKRADDAFY